MIADAAPHSGLSMIVYIGIGAAATHGTHLCRMESSRPWQHRHETLRRPSDSKHISDRAIDLLEAEWRIAETNVCIEHQRQLIERFGYEGKDITSESPLILDDDGATNH